MHAVAILDKHQTLFLFPRSSVFCISHYSENGGRQGSAIKYSYFLALLPESLCGRCHPQRDHVFNLNWTQGLYLRATIIPYVRSPFPCSKSFSATLACAQISGTAEKPSSGPFRSDLGDAERDIAWYFMLCWTWMAQHCFGTLRIPVQISSRCLGMGHGETTQPHRLFWTERHWMLWSLNFVGMRRRLGKSGWSSSISKSCSTSTCMV